MAEKEFSLQLFHNQLNQIFFSDIEIIKPKFKKRILDKKLIKILQKLNPIRENSLIIVNDHDRSTPTAKIINLMRTAGFISDPVTFIIATGTHKFPVSANPVKLTGAIKGDSIIIHDCDDEKNMVYLGKTPFGTEVAVNKALIEYNNILTINSVEPHYFAGFTGGIKSIIPGLASRKTVEQNHRLAIKPESSLMKTENNPLHRDLWDAGNLLNSLQNIKTIQIVNHNENILYMSVGSLEKSFIKAKKQALNIYATKFQKKFDHIISFVSPPLSETLYQAQKAMENTKKVLKRGGTFTLIAKCERGIGNHKFFQRMQQLGTPEKIVSSLTFENYKFGDHKAYYWAELAMRANLYYLGDISSTDGSHAFMEKITYKQLLGNIKRWIEKKETILFDENGGMSVAYLKK
ncbi:MAG: lactate racemase domain-containing protein [Promethearchaeota archaeon]